MLDLVAGILILGGLLFYVAGTVGLLRLPDIFSRLHALTKADNLGLGLLVTGLAIQSRDPLTAAKLLLVWLLVLAASAAGSYLIAQYARRSSEQVRQEAPPA
jgi:multicomponent Na+:H+ antiporter subunit G